MKHIVFISLFLIACSSPLARSAAAETLTFGRFGSVTLYHQVSHPSHVVLFVSGDGGWNQGVVDMATALAGWDALVVGIDITHYLRALQSGTDACSYPAADFEALSQFVQQHLAFPHYIPPVLVGYSSGATLVYAILVQAPPGTFRGGLSLGFCPDLSLTKPLCRGHGLAAQRGPHGKGYSFLPSTTLDTPWVALQGMVDQVCDPTATDAYVKQVRGAKLVSLPKVGHGFSVPRNWLPQFQKAFMDLVQSEEISTNTRTPSHASLTDLPLVEVPPREERTTTMSVILSGDGGWASIDRDLGNALAADGIAVVGVNSLQYFWTRRTPEGAATGLERILRHYFAAWKKDKAVLIGYSLGADVLPFMVNRLPQDLRARVPVVALLNPARTVDFEFHVIDWLVSASHPGSYALLPELQRLQGPKLLCFYGADETDSLCKDLPPQHGIAIRLQGGHHFNGKYEVLASRIMREAQVATDAARTE